MESLTENTYFAQKNFHFMLKKEALSIEVLNI